MKKLTWILITIISVLIAVKMSFYADSFAIFLKNSIIFSFIIFGIIIFAIKSFQNAREKNVKKAVLFGILVFVLLLTIFAIDVFSKLNSLCSAAVSPAHYRTNIITGQCDFGGWSGCSSSFYPWYYRRGCDISPEEKVEVLKKGDMYNNYEFGYNEYELDRALKECENICQRNNAELYCTYKGGISDNFRYSVSLTCNDILSCEAISC